jgi:hypothetical protein
MSREEENCLERPSCYDNVEEFDNRLTFALQNNW